MQWQRHCTPKIGHCCRIRPPSGVLFVRSIISHETRGKYWLSSILLEIAIKLPLIFSLWHTVIYKKKQSTVDFEIVTHSITNNPPPRCIINWTSFVCLFLKLKSRTIRWPAVRSTTGPSQCQDGSWRVEPDQRRPKSTARHDGLCHLRLWPWIRIDRVNHLFYLCVLKILRSISLTVFFSQLILSTIIKP